MACDQDLVYEKNYAIENSNWMRSDHLNFEFDIQDSSAIYHIYFNFRHAGDYPYRNLYLFTQLKNPKGQIAIDTAQMILADTKGRWMGKGIGDIYDYQFKFKEQVKFPFNGSYQFQIEHGMREKVLPNITDLGIRIEKEEDVK